LENRVVNWWHLENRVVDWWHLENRVVNWWHLENRVVNWWHLENRVEAVWCRKVVFTSVRVLRVSHTSVPQGSVGWIYLPLLYFNIYDILSNLKLLPFYSYVYSPQHNTGRACLRKEGVGLYVRPGVSGDDKAS